MFKRKLTVILLLVTMLVGGLAAGWLQGAAPARAETVYAELQLFTDVLSIVRRSYVEEMPVKDLVYGAIDGMLASLDPHSGFMRPDVYKEMKIDTRGEFGGLGIEITIKDEILTIVAPIEDTPAFRAGLAAGDRILKIGDQFTKGMEIMEGVRLMRGTPGTEINITVMRDDFERPREFTLKREIIKVKSVKSKTLEDGFGYLRVTQFQERTASDLARALDLLRKENGGTLKGVILDLRNNPGGLLDQAVEVADLFLDEGLIVYTKGREADSQMQFSAKRGTEPGGPMVVLINGGSASASEIVAGALQDHGRAVILGAQSFGKGSVQTILPIGDDAGLRLTTARYYTPKGTSIQAKGITPDIVVLPLEVKEAAERGHFREKDLRNHFDGEQANPPTQPEKGNGSHFQVGIDQRSDYQLMRALDLLKGWQIFQGLQRQAS